jgi:hypothetical protein
LRFCEDDGSSPEAGELRLRMDQLKRQTQEMKPLGFGNRA